MLNRPATTGFRYRPTARADEIHRQRYRASKRLCSRKYKWLAQVMHDHELSAATRVVGYALADHASMEFTAREFEKSGFIEIYCSQERLAQMTNLSERTISTAIARLIDRKHLHRLRRGRPRKGASRYLILHARSNDLSKDLAADFSS